MAVVAQSPSIQQLGAQTLQNLQTQSQKSITAAWFTWFVSNLITPPQTDPFRNNLEAFKAKTTEANTPNAFAGIDRLSRASINAQLNPIRHALKARIDVKQSIYSQSKINFELSKESLNKDLRYLRCVDTMMNQNTSWWVYLDQALATCEFVFPKTSAFVRKYGAAAAIGTITIGALLITKKTGIRNILSSFSFNRSPQAPILKNT